ncbi:MAG TPA: hypothetical protein VN377_01140 [Candidatus Thermoplasmatota archaeon]|nr:hypothetical protein [Candidatus Thermoplasmatota archaeon]
MKRLFIGIGILAILSISYLSGCLDEKSKFIGTWETQDGSTSMTFDTNNKVTISGSGPLAIVSLTGLFAYSLANQKITFSSGDTGITLNYSFPSSNQLILSNDQGASLVLTKK